MSTLKRAFLYTMRKKTKTLILFLVLVTISTFILTGLSIYKAADDSALSLRQSVGGSIRLELDKSNNKNWRYQQAAGGMLVEYVGTPITDRDIQKIMSIDGVKAYNGIGDGDVYAKDFDFISGISFGAEIDDSRLPSVTNSEYFNFFTRKAFQLVEGRHIKEDDDHVVLISSAIAEKNNLKLGDTITVQCCFDNGDYPDVKLKVVGIYTGASTGGPGTPGRCACPPWGPWAAGGPTPAGTAPPGTRGMWPPWSTAVPPRRTPPAFPAGTPASAARSRR